MEKFFIFVLQSVLKTGNLGEDLVVKYLKKDLEFKIIDRNFSYKTGEIDIIAKDKRTVVFVEVKALDAKYIEYFKPEEHFDYKKAQRVIKTAQVYLIKNNYPEDTDYRIDLAALEINNANKVARLRYYRNAVR